MVCGRYKPNFMGLKNELRTLEFTTLSTNGGTPKIHGLSTFIIPLKVDDDWGYPQVYDMSRWRNKSL